jgi:putative addiction module component (TIGR02574 family)
MEKLDIPISKLTLAQKLNLMETLWDEISKDEYSLESPDWHADILNERRQGVKDGDVKLSDWSQVKERIKSDLCHCSQHSDGNF